MEWRTDYDNAPKEAYDFFIVRQKGFHQASGKPFLPVVVQQIEGRLYSPNDELTELVFGEFEPIENWKNGHMEWMKFPKEWGY